MKAGSENTQSEPRQHWKIARERIETASNQRRQQRLSRAHVARIKLSSFRVYRASFRPSIIDSIKVNPSIVAQGPGRTSVRRRHALTRGVLLSQAFLLHIPETSWQ